MQIFFFAISPLLFLLFLTSFPWDTLAWFPSHISIISRIFAQFSTFIEVQRNRQFVIQTSACVERLNNSRARPWSLHSHMHLNRRNLPKYVHTHSNAKDRPNLLSAIDIPENIKQTNKTKGHRKKCMCFSFLVLLYKGTKLALISHFSTVFLMELYLASSILCGRKNKINKEGDCLLLTYLLRYSPCCRKTIIVFRRFYTILVCVCVYYVSYDRT